VGVGLVGEPDHVEQLACALLGGGLVHAQDVDRRLGHVAQGGHVGEQVEVLEDEADLAAHPSQVLLIRIDQPVAAPHVPEGIAVDRDLPAGRPLQRHQQAQERRLAGAARPDDRELLAPGDVEIELVEHREIAEPLGDAFEAHAAGMKLDRGRRGLGGVLRFSGGQGGLPVVGSTRRRRGSPAGTAHRRS
jgi:hypothetical protein